MFSIIDLLTITIIIILIFFLIILFQLEKSFAKPRIYLRAALLLIIFIGIIEELVLLKQYSLIIWIFPLIILGYLSVYPLVYLYSRDLVFNGKDKNRPKLLTILAAPLVSFIFVSIIYYPLDYNSKVMFINLNIDDFSQVLMEHTIMQYFVIPMYYMQVIFYMTASLKLISVVRKNISSNPWELILAKYILFYVAAVIFYEAFMITNTILFSNNIKIMQVIGQLLSLLFISLGLYIGFKQSLIIIQSRINKYSHKLEAGTESMNSKIFLLENEKQEIKEAIENFFADSKIYLNPNLKLEQLSKKIHITGRKVSLVINEVYGTNFNNFINEYRISEAKRLISANPLSIKIDHLYTHVGFNSRSVFNSAFKTSMNMTPIDYIKSISKK